MHEAEKT